MGISFDKVFGVHDDALALRTQRAEVIANNIANADTPNYKARDLDFYNVLKEQSARTEQADALSLDTTRSGHIEASGIATEDPNLLYRTPDQPSIDGNTVEIHHEQAEFMKNALQFQASFRFVDGRFKSLNNALRGE